jgi:hypothetical protein
MRRPQPACLAVALALLLAAVPVAQAQLGGLVKKKAVEKVKGKDTVAVAGKAAKPRCDASSMAITGDVVDRYLKSQAAAGAEMQKLAREPGKTGAYYSALLQQQAITRRKAEYDLHRGPDWEKHKALEKRYMSEATAGKDPTPTMHEDHALIESLNPGRVQVPELEWEDQQKASARVDSTMRVAGGFSQCDWTDLGERLPRMVGLLVNDPKTKDFQGYGTEKDAAAIRPRVPELARAMGMTYVSPEDKARLKKEEDDAKAAAAAPRTTGDPRLDCMAKVQGEWAKRHKAEMDAAQEKEDVATLMKLSMEMNSEAMAKCPSE